MNGISVRLVLLFFSVIYSLNVVAANPGKVEGNIMDGVTSQFLPYVNIELLKSPDSTLIKVAISNNEGSYMIEDIAYGKYLLRISCIGYKNEIVPEFELSTENPVIKLGTTNLLPESKSLNEVVVTGQKLTGIMEDDKTIYIIKPKSTEIAQSGIELLRQLPDVTVDYISENVKLAGSSNILFQVNGRKVDHNYLTQLNPELVEKIEVVNNPGAKYESDVDAVINLILKKNMQYGLSGRLRIQVPTSADIMSKNNGSTDLFFKNVRFYVTGKYNIQQYNSETSNYRVTFSPDSTVLSQKSKGTNNDKKAGASYGFDWFLNDNNTLNFYSTIRPRISAESELVTDNIYSSNQINSHTRSKNTRTDNNYFYDYSLFYQHKFAKKFHEISLESYLSDNSNEKTSNYYEQEYISETILSNQLSERFNQVTENGIKQLILKADYRYPFSEKLKLSIGYNGNYQRSEYFYTNILVDYADRINYAENRHAAYSSLSFSASKFNFQTGLRYEYSDINIIFGNDVSKQYSTLLPSVSMQYQAGKKNSFRLNYRKSLTRPGINQLSPISYTEDSYQQTIGNRNLNPAFINRFELSHRIQIGEQSFLNDRPYFSFIKNDIRLVTLADSDSILTKEYINVGNDFEYGITFSGTLAFVKNLTINPSWTYYRRSLKALPEYGINEDMKRTSWRLNVSAQYLLPKQWVLFIEYNYNAPIINYQSATHPYYDFIAGFNKAINKKMNITVLTINPWSNRYVYDNRTITTTNMVQNSKDAIRYNYLFFIRLGYKFNSGKTGKKVEREVETEEEKGVNKGIIN